MVKIIDIVIFYSNFSKFSRKLNEYINSEKISLRYICIDSIEMRDRILKTHIDVVPSMMVVYDNDDIEIYKGVEKIIIWLKSLLISYRDNKNTDENIEDIEYIEGANRDNTREYNRDNTREYNEDNRDNRDDSMNPNIKDNINPGIPEIPNESQNKMASLRAIAKQMEEERTKLDEERLQF